MISATATISGTPTTIPTHLEPLGLAILLTCIALLLIVKRRAATFPFLVVVCFLSLTQRVVIAGLDFNFLRLMIVAGIARVAMRGEWRGPRLHELDVAFISAIVGSYSIAVLRAGEVSYLVTVLGNTLDALGIYFLFRILIRSWGDLDQFGKYVSIVLLMIALFFLVEWATLRNYFSLFGPIPEFTELHKGEHRAKGAFAHGLLAGCFAVTLLPLIVVRWWNPRANKLLVIGGALSALAIIVACASSTPFLALAAGIGATFLFPLRANLRLIRWGVFGLLVFLHIVMKAPVWHLAARINIFGGSTGWHRFNLIDKFIANFDDWWLMGTSYTGHWGGNLVDVTNAFVLWGLRGGLLGLTLYIVMVTLAFRRVGWLIRRAEGHRVQLVYAWAIGVALFCHMVSHFAISYFAQILLAFYGTLGVVASLSASAVPLKRPRRVRAAPERSRRPEFAAAGQAARTENALPPTLSSRLR